MIDFGSREYLRISAYWKDWAICFVMENGLCYMVSTKPKGGAFPIMPAICTDSHTKMNPYTDDINEIPKAELKRALKNLKTGKLEDKEQLEKHFGGPRRNVWLKWTEKYQAEIHNLKLYYDEKMNHCPTPVDDISIDFENREYVKVAGYWPEAYVCFVMKNGLSYCVGIERKEIIVDVHPYAHFNDYGAFFEEPAKMPKSELKIAEKILKTARLPELSNEDIRAFQFWFQLHRESNTEAKGLFSRKNK